MKTYMATPETVEKEWFVVDAQGQTLGVAIQSYHGKIGIGLLGDAEALRDLPVLANAVPSALDELAAIAAGHHQGR